MSEANDHQPFPLFKGACRLPTVFGIPRSIVIYLGVGGGMLFLFIKFYALPFILLAFAICWSVTLYDARAFRILGLWFKTKFQNTRKKQFFQLWKASSYSPIRYRRKDLP
ncbi:VirB3 family type IV secretion system protein [Marinobacter sp.]|uniref:VirB3 family type IV secretion system protein n=1 Tax=Marinobacter sp. TaxID=50741 RepID=UPI003A8FC5BE